MDKRQIKKLLIFASLNLFLIGGFLFNHAKDDIFNTRANNPLDCADYFAESNDYSSIYEINQDLIAGTAIGTYKTWGTVTNTFSNSNGNFNFYVQSSDQYHQTSGIHIYKRTIYCFHIIRKWYQFKMALSLRKNVLAMSFLLKWRSSLLKYKT